MRRIVVKIGGVASDNRRKNFSNKSSIGVHRDRKLLSSMEEGIILLK